MPKTVEQTIYQIHELSKDIQLKAWGSYNSNGGNDYPWHSENKESLQAFKDLFNNGVFEDDTLKLKGIRLATYLYNNYIIDLYSGKYYSNGTSHRYSNCTKEITCPFTGYYMDEVLLKAINDFIDAPNGHQGIYDLYYDSLENYRIAVDTDFEYYYSFEVFKESCEINQYWFTKNGDFY